MVWKRAKRYAKKQMSRAKSWATSRYSKGGIRQLVRDVAYVKGLVNSERKWKDTAISSTLVEGSSVLHRFTGITQGDQAYERNGNQVRLKSFQTILNFERPDGLGGTANANFVRVILFMDNDPNIGTPLITDLLTIDRIHALRNYEYAHTKRYRVLKDVVMKLDEQNPSRLFKIYKKMSSVIRFNGTAATNYANNQLCMFIMSDNTGAASNCTVSGTARITFYDN